jgi:hypothetical protein
MWRNETWGTAFTPASRLPHHKDYQLQRPGSRDSARNSAEKASAEIAMAVHDTS